MEKPNWGRRGIGEALAIMQDNGCTVYNRADNRVILRNPRGLPVLSISVTDKTAIFKGQYSDPKVAPEVEPLVAALNSEGIAF
jgi:hypothetical protein